MVNKKILFIGGPNDGQRWNIEFDKNGKPLSHALLLYPPIPDDVNMVKEGDKSIACPDATKYKIERIVFMEREYYVGISQINPDEVIEHLINGYKNG